MKDNWKKPVNRGIRGEVKRPERAKVGLTCAYFIGVIGVEIDDSKRANVGLLIGAKVVQILGR